MGHAEVFGNVVLTLAIGGRLIHRAVRTVSVDIRIAEAMPLRPQELIGVIQAATRSGG